VSAAHQIISAEVERYRSEGGWEGDLLRCVDRLIEIGKDSIHAVLEFVSKDSPEVEYFIPLITSEEWLPEHAKMQQVMQLLASNHAGVRREAAEWVLMNPELYRDWLRVK
jgi:hypothetical protein